MNADAKGRLPTDAAAVNARAATLAALRKALPSLTSARPPAGDDETEFWNAWWTSNAARIIGAGQP
jgi:cytochrome c556